MPTAADAREGPPAKLTHDRIFAVVRRIPAGRVATYGQVAALAGFPRNARQVGYALSALHVDSPVPWHRVVNAQGTISPRTRDAGGAMHQQVRLAQEGVVLRGGRVPLREYAWHPDTRTPRHTRRRGVR